MKHVILITGASSGFGALAARALAHAGQGAGIRRHVLHLQ
jgi:NADP-dependent 3-hydroxy acid dehydrogenase YdfG